MFCLHFFFTFFQQLSEEGTALVSPNKDASESKGSMISASFNFINSIIGSGIIGKYWLYYNQSEQSFSWRLITN